MGINAGHLGFLTSAPSNGLNLIFREIAEGNIATEPRSMLRVTGEFARQPESQLALNEFTVQRHGAGMISVETYVDRQMVATYHGDGVIVSTPTGIDSYSSGARRSRRGPDVPVPGHLAPGPPQPHDAPGGDPRHGRHHAQRGRPAGGRLRHAGQPDLPRFARRVVHRGAGRTDDFLAVPHNISFYDTLRNKMMWGIDIRS